MNILIIEPPPVSKFGNSRIFGASGSNKGDISRPPLDLMMISGYLKKVGYENILLDANAARHTIDIVKEMIKQVSPDVIFFSTSTCTIYKDLLVAKVAKEVNPSIITAAIGTHVGTLPEETFSESEFLDVIIYGGEWEQVSLNIVENLSNLENAKGIFLRKEGGEIIKTELQSTMQNIDDLGFPSHDKLVKNLYGDPTSRRFPKTIVMGQKACMSNCSFCCQPAFFGAPTIRRRSVQNFVEELKWIRQLGFKEVMFNDATLTSDFEWSAALFEEMLTHSIDLSWNCSTRVDRLNRDILKLMKRAGCHTISIGLESANATVMKNIRKNVNPEQVRDAVRMIRAEGMDSLVFCVIGFPGETKESILETIAFVKTLDTVYITLGIATPVLGTDFFRYLEKNDYLHTKDWSLYDPLKKPVFSYPSLSADEMYYYSINGIKSFYLRPKYIMGRMLSIRNFKDVGRYHGNFVNFLKRFVLPGVNK